MRKQEVAQIVGKTIKHIVAKENPTAGPRYQLFLVFTDDTYYEFWSNEEIEAASHLQSGGLDGARTYGTRGKNIVVEI